ncbi:MAG TPA: hypothetical protein VEU07_06000 [Candidatus Acidoferrum sp.]|nr:hypothetical protein [Candidatus Acidoferrum sp.]
MRILLLMRDEHDRDDVVRALEARGHGVIQATSGGEDVLTAVEHAGRLHAALLDQVALGNGWPRLLRLLRRRAPSLPAVILLGPEAERSWRLAVLAGAFDALPESSPPDAVLCAVDKALSYSTGRLFTGPLPADANAVRETARSAASKDRWAQAAPRQYESAA